MNKNELKQYLKDNLKMTIYYSPMSHNFSIKLNLDGETIAEAKQRL